MAEENDKVGEQPTPDKSEQVEEQKIRTSINNDGHTVVTMHEQDYVFGPPLLKHRKLIGRIISEIQGSPDGKNAIGQIAEDRGISVKEASKLEEHQLTDEEKTLLGSSMSIESVSGVVTEAIFVALRKAPFEFSTIEDIDNNMEYSDGLALLEYAMDQIKDAILTTSQRKN